jgi:hypothetical protein
MATLVGIPVPNETEDRRQLNPTGACTHAAWIRVVRSAHDSSVSRVRCRVER